MNKFIVCLSFLSVISTSFAQDRSGGSEGGGGGDAIICGKNKSYNLADIHDIVAKRPGYEFGTSFYYEIESAVGTQLEILRKDNPSLAQQVENVIPKLKFVFVDDLEELDDDGISEITTKQLLMADFQLKTFSCKKQQLAIQDRKSGIVRVNKRIYEKLATPEKALLRIHEAMIQLNPQMIHDTTQIRRLASLVYKNSDFKNDSAPWEILQYLSSRLPPHLSRQNKNLMIALAGTISAYKGLTVEEVIKSYRTHAETHGFLKTYKFPVKEPLIRLGPNNVFWNQMIPHFIITIGDNEVCGKKFPGFYYAQLDRANAIAVKLEEKYRTESMIKSMNSVHEYFNRIGKDACSELQKYPDIEQW